MKHSFPIIILLAWTNSLFAQSSVYQKRYKVYTYNHIPMVCRASQSGNIMICQVYAFVSGPQDVNLSKFDKTGNLIWSRTFGDSAIDEALYWPVMTPDSGLLAGGQLWGLGNGSGDMMLFKCDSSGSVQLCKAIGTSANEYAEHTIALMNGGYGLMGGRDVGVGGRNFYMARLDGNGNLIFAKQYGTSDSTDFNEGTGICQTPGDGFILGGYNRNSTTQGSDFFVIHVDSMGNVIWAKTYGMLGYQTFREVFRTPDDYYILLGEVQTSANQYFGLVVKIDIDGNIIWAKTYDTSTYIEYGGCYALNDGTFIIGGSGGSASFQSTFLMKLDSAGSVLWFKTYNIGPVGSNVCVNDNGEITEAKLFRHTSAHDSIIIARYTPDGSGCYSLNVPVVVTDVSLQTNSVNCLYNDTGSVVDYPIPFAAVSPGNDYDCIIMSVSSLEQEDNTISIYPNPLFSNSVLTLTHSPLLTPASLIINSTDGREVMRYPLQQGSTTEKITLPRLAAGVYLARMVGEGVSANNANVKFVVE